MQFRLPSLVTRIFGEAFVAYAWSLACLAGGAIYAHAHQPVTAALLAGAGMCLALLTTRAATVGVGAEGITLRWIGMSWSWGYDQIAGIEPHEVRTWTRLLYTQRKSVGVLLRRKNALDLYLVCDDATSRDLRAAVFNAAETRR